MLRNEQAREQWLDRAWALLLGDGDSLATPGRIRREGLDRARVRAAERAAIDTAAAELADLRNGRKTRTRDGRVVDSVAVGDVPMYSFIETPAVDAESISARFGSADQLLEAALGETARRDLERALNIRRIALLAEEEILDSYLHGDLTSAEPDSQWLRRWRQLAQDAGATELQRLWARALVREVAAPGRASLAMLEALGLVGEREVQGVLWLARYVFGEFIFDARGRYFQPGLHGAWVEHAATLGLLYPIDAPRRLQLHARASAADGPEQRPLLLINHGRALQLSGLSSVGVPLPVLRLTPVGKQLFDLCGGEADMAYLFDLADYLRACDVKIALGDWQPLHRRFVKRLDY